MASANLCIFMGNLTRDPDLKHTAKGTAVCEIGIAINETYTVNEEKREKVHFFNLIAWGRTAEVAGEFLKKGSLGYFQCRAQLDTWDDKESGKKRSAVKFVVEHMQLMPRSGGGGHAPSDEEEERHTHREEKRPPAKSKPPVDPDLDPDDDIPF